MNVMNAFHRETELEISSHWQSVHAIEVQQGRRMVWKSEGWGASSGGGYSRGCLIIIWTGLNIKIGIVQKVYEWQSWYFAKMIVESGDYFGKRTASSLKHFLNYVYFDI